MKEYSFFNNKSQEWWHLWNSSACGNTARDKSAQTRAKILMAAFDEIYHSGFQAASLNKILHNTETTKGALYHHFKNKMELGYAVVDEVIRDLIHNTWVIPLNQTDDPITTISQFMQQSIPLMNEHDIRQGCPLNNLSQEMSPIDEGFRQRILVVYQEWEQAVVNAFERGKLAGHVKPEVHSQQIGLLFIALMNGSLGYAKTTQDLATLAQCGEGYIQQLELLRPHP